MSDKKIYVDIRPEVLGNKAIKFKLYLADLVDSKYEGEQENGKRVRRLDKKYNNMSKRSKELSGLGTDRRTLKKSQDALIQADIYKIEENKDIIITSPQNYFVELYDETARTMIATLSDHAIKVYMFLRDGYRNWNLRQKIAFCFSKKQCAEAIGLSGQGYNTVNIEDILITLVENGLINFSIVRTGDNHYYRKLNYVSERFVIHEAIKEAINNTLEGLEEVEVITKDIINDNNTTILATIGYNPETLNQLNGNYQESVLQLKEKKVLPKLNLGNPNVREPRDYIPIDQIAEEYHREPHSMLDALEQWDKEYNQEYCNYERMRLKW